MDITQTHKQTHTIIDFKSEFEDKNSMTKGFIYALGVIIEYNDKRYSPGSCGFDPSNNFLYVEIFYSGILYDKLVVWVVNLGCALNGINIYFLPVKFIINK